MATSNQVLARGGFGVIYTSKLAQQPVVIKKVNYSKSNLLEPTIMSGLDSPYLVSSIQIYFRNNELFMLIPRALSDIKHYLNFNYLSLSRKTLLIEQVVAGIDFLHSQGIIHLDIKPQNVLLFSDSPLVTKITDFGISSFAGTYSQGPIGTKTYMAPEMWNRNTEITFEADYWSLGCFIYYILMEEQIFQSQNQKYKLYQEAIDYFFDPSLDVSPDLNLPTTNYYNLDLIDNWDNIIQALLQPKPSNRRLQPLLNKLDYQSRSNQVVSQKELYKRVRARLSKLSAKEKAVLEWIVAKTHHYRSDKPDKIPLYELRLIERRLLKELDYHVV